MITELQGRVLHERYPVAAGEIRLVVLLGGGPDAPMEALLEVRPLESCPPYNAVSYVWGADTLGRTIDVALLGTVKVTDNLYEILKHARLQEWYRWARVWVDAICINQLDDNEKAVQIPVMKDIYSNARDVFIWVGDCFPNEEDQLLKALALITEIANVVDPTSPLPMIPWSVIRAEAETWRYIRAFPQRPWFERAWTFQEALVAGSPTLFCGPHTIPWHTLMKCIEAIGHHQVKFVYMQMQPYKLLAFARSAKLYERNRYLDPAELLFARRACGATGPRDIVYAHLGLTNLTSTEIPTETQTKSAHTKVHFRILS